MLGDGKCDGVMAFSVSNAEFPLAERDVIQGNPADLNGPKPQGISQVDHGIGSDIRRGRKLKVGKEFLDFLRPQELGWLALSK